MPSTEQLHAYLHWLKERGIRYPRLAPALRPAAASAASAASASEELAATAVAPARVVFIGDAPLLAAERELLDRMVAAMRLGPGDVCITSVAGQDVGPRLRAQLAALRAELVVVMGPAAASQLLVDAGYFTAVRGRVRDDAGLGCRTLVTFHPRDLLKIPADKRLAWADLQAAMAALGLDKAP